MTKLLLFFYPERRDCLRKVVAYLRSRGVEPLVVADAGLRAVVEVPEGLDPRDLLSGVECVSRVGVVLAEIPRPSPSEVVEEVSKRIAEALRSLGRCVAIRCRRWDKTYPIKSVDLAKGVAERLAREGLCVSPKFRSEVLACIDRDRVWVAYVDESWERVREYLPKSVARRVTCVACMIQGAYEVADLIQLARALGVKMVLLQPRSDAVSRALQMLGLSALPSEVVVTDSVSEALRDSDAAILLSRYGVGNERTLIELAKRFRRVALVVGNEFSDPPPHVRDLCGYSVRLGPETGKALRSSTALAYALGIVFAAMWGAL